MLNNLPSASKRSPLANARAVMVALLVHAAVGAVIYMSAAIGGHQSESAAPEAQMAATPADPPPTGATSTPPAPAGQPQPSRPAAPATAEPDAIGPGDSPGAAAADLDIGDSANESALAQTALMIVLQAPDTMRLGNPYEVRVSLPPLPTPRRARGGAEDTARALRNGISPVRQATLAGGNVVVDPRTPALQLADPGVPTVWRWTVTPTEPGRSRLAAEVAVVHYRDGKERIATVRGLRKDVRVEATGEQRISRFFAAQWPGLLLLLLVSSIGWLRIRFWR